MARSVGFLFDNSNDFIKNVVLVSFPSHNNEEAIKGAEAVAIAIFFLRNGYDKNDSIK